MRPEVGTDKADVASAETPDQETGRGQVPMTHHGHGHGHGHELSTGLQLVRYRVVAIVSIP